MTTMRSVLLGGMLLAAALGGLIGCPKALHAQADGGAGDGGISLTCDVTAQDCADAGLACVYVNAGETSACRAGACDVATQSGCDLGQKCSYLSDGGVTARACGPNGTADAGEACGAAASACLRGLACVRVLDGGASGICRRFCETDSQCEGSDACGSEFILYEGTDESPSFCTAPAARCDVLSDTSCATVGPGLACYATLRGPECFARGTKPLDALCTFANDCASGLQCMVTKTQSVCRQVCAYPTGSPACPSGKKCMQRIPGEPNAGVCESP